MKVIIIVTDDQGREQFSDLGLGGITMGLGVDYPSLPNIQSLKNGAGGLHLSRFYAHPMCSTTRGSEITGLWPGNSGLGYIIEDDDLVPLRESNVTLPELLHKIAPNVRTATIGKLHMDNVQNGGADAWRRMGFEHFNGTVRNLPASDDPYRFYEYNVDGEIRAARNYWITRKTTDDAIRYLKKHAADDVYLRLCYHAPHAPFCKPPAGTYDDVKWVCAGGNYPVGQSDADLMRPYFKAMQENLDYEIGRLLAEINFSDTLVIFFADNGTANPSYVGEYNGVSGAYWTQMKRTAFEGGIHVPCFIKGAGVSGTARTSAALVSVVDIFPTVLDVFGLEMPETYADEPLRIDGQSFNHILENVAGTDRSYLLSELFVSNNINDGSDIGNRAIVETRYKLIWSNRTFFQTPSGMYDLQTDPMELSNLLLGTLSAPQQAAYNAMLSWGADQFWKAAEVSS